MTERYDTRTTTTVVFPNWFLQIFTGIVTFSIVGVAGWMGWVTRTLYYASAVVAEYPVLERRVTTVEGISEEHTRQIRNIKKVKVLK